MRPEETTAEDPPVDPVVESLLSRVARGVVDRLAPPLLITQESAPAFLGVKRTVFFQMKSAGRLPRPVLVDGQTVYRRSDLEAWVKQLKHARG